MASYKLAVALFLIIVHTCAIYGDDIKKSSLVFVIDDTGSMSDEIGQVKVEANKIFDTVLRSNASQIENFILVTFNDPDVRKRTVTKDRDEFKRALAEIIVDGGGDCPEYAMKGIELALQLSLPESYLYVFTDASAKDYGRFDEIKSIAQKQQSQVVFVLTGECTSESAPDYQVYHKVAEATSGQVFRMKDRNIKSILEYVEETITGRQVVLATKKLSPGYGKSITYPVDSHSGPVLIAVTGVDPKIGEITGPGGSKPTKLHLAGDERVAIVKVSDAVPGDHEVEVGSKSETYAVISAKTTITFQLGFSTSRPTSIDVATTRPAHDGKSFLSIKLVGDGVKLLTAKILDMSDNVIEELPLELADEKEKFYVAPSFDPPTTMFRVSVAGIDVESKTPVTRKSPTPIERRADPTIGKKINVAPEVKIVGAPKVITEYNEPFELKCTVHAYPEPSIMWEEKFTGITLPAKMSEVEAPYDFISILDIEKADKNATYQCKASNVNGISTKYIEVETKRTTYFDVIEAPKDTRIEYNKEGSIVCKISANPPATITWYKDGKLISGDANIEVSSDMSILSIQHMQPESQGKFMCEARNDLVRKVFFSNLVIFGLEKPSIDKEHDEIRVRQGTDAELTCRVIQGIPKPNIGWFFQHENKDRFTEMTETSEFIQLKNVGIDQSGTYRCIAKNIVGTDLFAMDLYVEYPPKIKADEKLRSAKDGDKVIIKCDVVGVPAPKISWFFNGTAVVNTAKTRISSRDNSLKLQATIADTGYYTCNAENEHGTDKSIVFLNVFVPVNIELPKVSTIESMVGKSVTLPCVADGYPRPEIKWTFYPSDPKNPPRDVTPTDGSTSINLRNVQLNRQGYYTCVADNHAGGSANFTYEVKVYAPPIIENVYPDKTFKVVAGDLALRIQCKATGSPKPTITWKKNDLNIAFGSEWYDMEEDGTLVIKNIDYKSQGTYICQAQNILGNDTEMYDVNVSEYPEAGIPTTTVFIEEGKSDHVKCNIPHKTTDSLRWFKDGEVVGIGEELSLYEVTRSDDGYYTCRVSDFTRSRSTTTEVKIGFKPRFVSEEEENIDFVQDALVLLKCEAVGEPMPEVSWQHNGKGISSTDMTYALWMALDKSGIYDCEVTNKFGSIHRSFNITSRDCILDIKNDFPEKQPLMYTKSLTWSEYEVSKGFMIIPHAEYFYLNCPTKFSNFPSNTNAMAFCEGDDKVKINGEIYNFAEIQCNDEIQPEVLKTGINCLDGNTEYIKIGYELFHEFLNVYDVCLDKDNNMPLFAKHRLSPVHTDSLKKSKWYENDLLPFDFDTMYDCTRQVYDISKSLSRGLRTPACCFDRRQLVNSHDLRPGVPTSASFSYLNVVPHWSTCNSNNWEDVEKRVRNLVKAAGRDLTVLTGTASPRTSSGGLSLSDGSDGKQPVAKYLWKVVQDPPSGASLAIIQVNVPELSAGEAPSHVLCRDICGYTEWMNNPNWNNVEDGFTYCCSITEFEKAFGYDGRFSPRMDRVLFNADLLPDYYLTKK